MGEGRLSVGTWLLADTPALLPACALKVFQSPPIITRVEKIDLS
jgi:hypothetical protein